MLRIATRAMTSAQGTGDAAMGLGPTRWVRTFRALARPTIRLLFRLLSHIELRGLERIPRSGAYLVAANHISLYEPPLILSFWPCALEVVGAVEVLDRPLQGQLMRMYGAIPVHRGSADRRLLKAMVSLLRAGRAVLIFPEGGRSHSPGMRRAWNGVAYVAGKAEVPVVPVGVTGTEHLTEAMRRGRRARLTMTVGETIHLPRVPWGRPERKAALQANTERVMRAIAALLPPGYRGVYDAED